MLYLRSFRHYCSQQVLEAVSFHLLLLLWTWSWPQDSKHTHHAWKLSSWSPHNAPSRREDEQSQSVPSPVQEWPAAQYSHRYVKIKLAVETTKLHRFTNDQHCSNDCSVDKFIMKRLCCVCGALERKWLGCIRQFGHRKESPELTFRGRPLRQIRSRERLALEMSAFEPLYCGQITCTW